MMTKYPLSGGSSRDREKGEWYHQNKGLWCGPMVLVSHFAPFPIPYGQVIPQTDQVIPVSPKRSWYHLIQKAPQAEAPTREATAGSTRATPGLHQSRDRHNINPLLLVFNATSVCYLPPHALSRTTTRRQSMVQDPSYSSCERTLVSPLQRQRENGGSHPSRPHNSVSQRRRQLVQEPSTSLCHVSWRSDSSAIRSTTKGPLRAGRIPSMRAGRASIPAAIRAGNRPTTFFSITREVFRPRD